jgi:hypothetical protein
MTLMTHVTKLLLMFKSCKTGAPVAEPTMVMAPDELN